QPARGLSLRLPTPRNWGPQRFVCIQSCCCEAPPARLCILCIRITGGFALCLRLSYNCRLPCVRWLACGVRLFLSCSKASVWLRPWFSIHQVPEEFSCHFEQEACCLRYSSAKSAWQEH